MSKLTVEPAKDTTMSISASTAIATAGLPNLSLSHLLNHYFFHESALYKIKYPVTIRFCVFL